MGGSAADGYRRAEETAVTLVKYAKQRKLATCKGCGKDGFTWFEDTDVTEPRAKKWYLSNDDGATVHEHDAKTPVRAKFTFLVAYTITAKDEADAVARISKWGEVIAQDADDIRDGISEAIATRPEPEPEVAPEVADAETAEEDEDSPES